VTKLAVAAGLACAIAATAPIVASAAPAAPAGIAKPATDQVPCNRPDYFQLWNGDNGKCYANFGPAFPNFRAAVMNSGNNCGTAYFQYPDGTYGQQGFQKNQSFLFPHNGQDAIVLVNQIDLGCIG
jgi:hypothetical protein